MVMRDPRYLLKALKNTGILLPLLMVCYGLSQLHVTVQKLKNRLLLCANTRSRTKFKLFTSNANDMPFKKARITYY